VGESDKEWGTVLERERHGSILKIGDTCLTGMKNQFDQSSLTDRENQFKNKLSSPQERYDDIC
jgi:hypothetical protein